MKIEECKTLDDIVSFVLKTYESISDQDEQGRFDELISNSEDNFISKEHSYFGRWIRNHSGMWDKESAVYNHFKDAYGLIHADNMSWLVFHCVWRDYHNKSRDIKTLLDFIKQDSMTERLNKQK